MFTVAPAQLLYRARPDLYIFFNYSLFSFSRQSTLTLVAAFTKPIFALFFFCFAAVTRTQLFAFFFDTLRPRGHQLVAARAYRFFIVCMCGALLLRVRSCVRGLFVFSLWVGEKRCFLSVCAVFFFL
jgi:hypothetical protein